MGKSAPKLKYVISLNPGRGFTIDSAPAIVGLKICYLSHSKNIYVGYCNVIRGSNLV